MPDAQALLDELSEKAITTQVALRHDEARASYTLQANQVENFDEFNEIIADYYSHHFARAVAPGAEFPVHEAASRAKAALVQVYHGRGGTRAAYADAHNGANEGLRRVLDVIANSLKREAIENYVRDVFDRHVSPMQWERKVELIQDFFRIRGRTLGDRLDVNHPEHYATDFEEIIREYTESLFALHRRIRRL